MSIFENIKKLFKEKMFIEIMLLLLFIAQLLVVIYFNLTTLINHMSFDSSWSFLKAALMWNEKTISSNLWAEQTSTFFDSSMPLASLLYGITNELFISYGLANIFVVVCVLLCMNSILNLLEINNLKAKLFVFNLIICPFLTNGFHELGYFNTMLGGPAFYSVRALTVMLVIREYLFIRKNNKSDFLGIVTLFLCFVAGTSSGIFLIVTILFPCVLFFIEIVFIENTFEQLKKKESIYIYIAIILVIIGKLYTKYIIGIGIIDESRKWTTLTKLFTNFGAPLQGFMKLLGALPLGTEEINILSSRGIITLFPLFIFIVIVFGIGHSVILIKNRINIQNYNILFLINVIVVNYLVFSLFNAQYGSLLFEERYLIPTFMIILMLLALYIQHLGKETIFAKTLSTLLLICIIANNIVSNYIYMKNTNDSWQMQEIKEIVNDQDAGLVYFWGNKVRTLGRCMRVYDMDHIYKEIVDEGFYYHWGDYKYYEDNSDYNGRTILVISNDEKDIPENVLNEYTLIKKLNYVSMYKSEINAIDRISGITGEISIDFPSTPGMRTKNGIISGNSFISDGNEGVVLWGPYCETREGNYSFIIDYSIIEDNGAYFEVSVDNGETSLGKIELDNTKNTAEISNIHLENGKLLEYRVLVNEGTIIKVNKITIKRNANTTNQ